MRYLSLDLETTGLNPEKCQILQIAAVLDDTDKPFEDCRTFNYLIYDENYTGEPYALAMNAEILRTISRVCRPGISIKLNKHTAQVGTISSTLYEFSRWLNFNSAQGITLAGKNVSGLDIPFLRKADCRYPFNHRVIDIGNLYFRPSDMVVPDMLECMARANIPATELTHDALDDALLNCKLIREWSN